MNFKSAKKMIWLILRRNGMKIMQSRDLMRKLKLETPNVIRTPYAFGDHQIARDMPLVSSLETMLFHNVRFPTIRLMYQTSSYCFLSV